MDDHIEIGLAMLGLFEYFFFLFFMQSISPGIVNPDRTKRNELARLPPVSLPCDKNFGDKDTRARARESQ